MNRLDRRHVDHHLVHHRVLGRYDVDDRVEALRIAVAASAAPTVLVAHSAGCLTVATWALGGAGPVIGALLATPPDLSEPYTDGEQSLPAMPAERLPFPAILAASRDDPVMEFHRARHWAEAWGAELVDLGNVGHLGSADGFGPWPLGDHLIERLRT